MVTISLALIAGIIIGPLARLVLPGKQDISMAVTVILGAVGALAGSTLFRLFSGRTDTSGVDWIAFALGVAVAALAIWGYDRSRGRARSGSSGHPIT